MTHCRYHAERAALWDCPGCEASYCGDCIPGGEENFGHGEPRCPLCLKALAFLGQGVEAEPFWRRSRDIFGYGLRTGPLVGALLAGLVTAMSPGLIQGLLALMVDIVVIKYGLMATVKVASGDWQPPSLWEAVEGDLTLFFKQLGLILAILLVPGLVVAAGAKMLGGLFFFLALLAVPAGIMILAMSESLREALNPLTQLKLIVTVGWPYLLLWFALMAVISAPDLAAWLLSDTPAEDIGVFLVGALAFYSTVVAYALMGYLLFQHADDLGIAGYQERGRSLPADLYPRRQGLGLSHVYAREGRMDDALAAVERGLSEGAADPALHERKHRLLKAMKKDKSLIRHAHEYCSLLVRAGNPGSATSVVEDVWRVQPDFRPQDPAVALAVAEVFYQQGKMRQAKKLLVNLHRDHPGFDGLGTAYLLLARIYLEGFDNRDNALRLLRFLKQKRPASLTSREGKDLLGLIRQAAS